MAVAHRSCSLTVKSEALNCLIEIVQLLGEIESPNEHFVPSTSLVRKSGETFSSDPLQEIYIRHA